MQHIDIIRAPIREELKAFEKVFNASMRSSAPLLDKVMQYIVRTKGKKLRPMFVLLTASVNGGINESTYRAASLIELLHTATLVHDDVVDDSNQRRGFFSVNALWKNKIAVLAGDYLLSRGMLLAVENNDYHLLRIVSKAVKEMSEGELLQIEKARRLDVQEDVYFDIIRKKTASLIAACCAVGAASAGAEEDAVQRMSLFGTLVGTAFQIKDDILDFQDTSVTGKPSGIDIKERKMTLPLIYLLNRSNRIEKRRIINLVKNHNNEPDKVNELMSKVRASGGLDYASQKMNEIVGEAMNLLEGYPQSEALNSLKALVEYSIQRKN
ncbi:MAG: polyprenyl synthetase family protein [Bacteroidia bacterium]|jgi:octaprenyl-diphosphate synthase|nr:polyprenyl synthetase family protein [Bacteroidia bacterium]